MAGRKKSQLWRKQIPLTATEGIMAAINRGESIESIAKRKNLNPTDIKEMVESETRKAGKVKRDNIDKQVGLAAQELAVKMPKEKLQIILQQYETELLGTTKKIRQISATGNKPPDALFENIGRLNLGINIVKRAIASQNLKQ